jgi:hypothetical protein
MMMIAIPIPARTCDFPRSYWRGRGMRDLKNNNLNWYEPVEGKLLVDTEIASASSAYFYVYRNNKDDDAMFCVDDVSLTLSTESFEIF